MSSELLREAAALMRERAEAATWTDAPWGVDEIGAVWAQEADGQSVPISSRSTDENAEHIASWHPAVALAVADWLTVTAWWIEDELHDDPAAPMDWTSSTGATAERVKAALKVARTYLGRAS